MLGKIDGKRKRGWQRMRWARQHYQLSGHEFEQTLGVSEGQGSLVCCSPWGGKASDMAEGMSTNNILSTAGPKKENLVNQSKEEGLPLYEGASSWGGSTLLPSQPSFELRRFKHILWSSIFFQYV